VSDVVVFVGPSLAGAQVDLAGVQVRPPAAQGDLYRAALGRPAAIALIDGVFGRQPAVWHKEVLWALAKGIPVVGGASMGALRAAELSSFGMVGVGQIFRRYESGECNDDDEVALLHSDAAGGYRPLTEPLVNVRATIAAAQSANVLSAVQIRLLLTCAKRLHYTERTWESLLDAASSNVEWDDKCRRAFTAWLATGKVDQKRLDAEQVLDVARALSKASPSVSEARFEFQYTDAWHKMAAAVEAEVFASREHPQSAEIIDELRLRGESTFRLVLEAALVRVLARGGAPSSFQVSETQLQRRIEAYRRARGLYTIEQLGQWLDAGDESPNDLSERLRTDIHVDQLLDSYEPEVLAEVPRILRAHPSLRGLIGRARSKAETLARRGQEEPSLHGTGLTDNDVVRSYFLDVLRQPVPRDLAAYADGLRLTSRHQLLRLLLREYWFAHADSV
jgi:hypothetical protein